MTGVQTCALPIYELIKVKTMPAPAVDYKKLYEDAQKKLDEIKKIVG